MSMRGSTDMRFDTSTWEDAPDAVSDGPEDTPHTLTKEDLETFKKKQEKRGIVYVSRIPPGMTPAKIRHIFSQVGEIGRMYLKPADKNKPGEKRKRGTMHFAEGWIEFLSKRVAKSAAEMLNAQPIGALGGSAHSSRRSQSGSRVANRWKDDIWTMKYLKGFRWPMLMEQMTHERASHAARLRMELSQSAYEQHDYLRKAERARIQRNTEEKRTKRGLPQEATQDAFTFHQRAPVYRDVRDQRTAEKSREVKHTRPQVKTHTMDNVLNKIF